MGRLPRRDAARAPRLRPALLPARQDPALKKALLEARLLQARGEPTAALAAADALIAREPGCIEAHLLRADALLALQREDEAEAAQREALGLDPESAPAWNALARLLHGQARDGEALAAAETARARLDLVRNGRFAAPVFLTLVWIHREARRYREAMACAEEGLDRCPDAVLAQWATDVQREWDASQREEC